MGKQALYALIAAGHSPAAACIILATLKLTSVRADHIEALAFINAVVGRRPPARKIGCAFAV